MPPAERFSSVCGKAVKKPVVMGFWPHSVDLMAASPSLGLKGGFSAEGDHFFHWRSSPLLKSGANSESCQSSRVCELPIERRWWIAHVIDVDGGAQT